MTKNVTFSLPAEALQGATEAFLLGDFNNWNPENAPKLEKQPDGSYKTAAQLEEGKTYQYRFLLNDGRWVNDYHAQKYVPVSGLYVDNCVITVPESNPEENKEAMVKKAAPGKTNVVKLDTAEEKPSKTSKKTSAAKSPKKTTAKTKEEKAAPKTRKAKSASDADINQKVVRGKKSSEEKKNEKE